MQIALSDVSYTYPEAVDPIITHASLVFPEGWTAVMGDNGCGKTTLVKLACGILQPDEGTVSSGLFAVYCAQETSTPPEGLDRFAESYDKDALELREGLRLSDDMPWRYDGLSCGEQKKLQVAVALWQRPDVLVLDEPSNHLDHDARMELLSILRCFKGVGILVSHDREMLEALAARCVSFEDGDIVVRNGGFADVMAQMGIERTAREHERASAKRELTRLTEEKNRRAQQAARADARSSKRHIDPKDHDAKGKIDLAVYSGQDGVRGKMSVQMDSRLASAQQRVREARVEKRYDGDIWFDATVAERKVLVRVPEGEIPCGDGQLAFGNLYVGNADHIGIQGPNGAGKSTLVGYIRRLVPDDLEVLDIPQEISTGQQERVLDEVARLDAYERGQVLSTVAQLNSRPDGILSGAQTSPGELRKLMLALGILRHPVLIIMDEPTNHLDLHSVEALERALAAYPGALLLVSHDAAFLDACTDHTWEVRAGKVREVD
jgi:ATPase subunit of ABC transporter with duplicated ATPase domains